MLVVFTGNGKGKTTAALGQAVRAVGRGRKVLMVQFIKGPWTSGEDFVEMKRKKDGQGEFILKKMGLGFVGILDDKLPLTDHITAAESALAYIKTELVKNVWHLIILDEVNVAVSLNLISKEAVLDIVKSAPPDKLILLTGRGAPIEFIEVADLVSEMKEVKHPFQDGKLGKVTVEF